MPTSLALNASIALNTNYTLNGDSRIYFDFASNSGVQLAQTTYSWEHTLSVYTTFTSKYRALFTGVSLMSAGSVSSVKFTSALGTTNLNKIVGTTTGLYGAELWGAMGVGTVFGTITVTLSASVNSVAGAVSYYNVAQTNFCEGSLGAVGTGATANISPVTVANNDFVIDCISTNGTAIAIGTSTAGTSRADIGGTAGYLGIQEFGPKTPAGTVPLSWVITGALNTYAYVATGFKYGTTDAPTVGNFYWRSLTGVGI